MKDNFLLKKSHQEIFNELSDEEAGKLIKGIFQYVNTENSGLNGILNAVFIPIKNYIDENEKKYEVICERNRQNGLNGGRPKKEEKQNPVGYDGLEKETQKTQMDILGANTHISYITNHKLNNNLEKEGYGEEKPLIASEGSSLLETTKEIISYLNEVTKSKFKYSSKATQSKINARLNEGYILDDFIAVIDKKWVEWQNTDFEKYMCPETLFGTKFEKYLNQKTKSKSKNDEQWELLKGMANGTITIN